ncbi:MAG TPA: FKBP-type peptidyl-prolyl cis-trans isomerase [Solirubrobacter sp.]|nr:FKBP-type peptidyl-prolyl cis-trans isomerase [Solirubrobacter sp.]
MRRHRYLLFPMLLAALAFAFAACGDDSSSSDETAAAPTETATEAATEAPTEEAAPTGLTEGDSGVKVSGKLGAAPKVEVPEGKDPPAGLVYKDLKVGSGPAAAAGQTVSVQYFGALFSDGSKFDASWDRGGEPFEFSLGSGQVIQGWDEGLVGMKKGGRRVLTIPPSMAYGEQGSGPIGPNETLVFVVDLEDIKSP